MSWIKVKLADVTEYITDGDHQPAPKSETGIFFVKIKDIQNNKVVFDNALFVPQQYYDRLPQNRKAVNGDTLYTVVGSYGIPAFVNHDFPFCFERNIALLHPNGRVVPQYLYYAVKNPAFYEYANNIANGSAQKLIPLSKLASMEIVVPPLEIQKKIVVLLSAYDDLIENNQQQIKLLEEAAQRLYKEWFVDLRFPGHETTPIVDGVPEGWSRKTVEECLSVHGNGGWGKETSMGKNEHPGKVIRGTDIEDVKAGRFNDIPLRYHTDNDIKKRTLKIHDLVFELSNGNINNIGRCLLIDDLVLKNCGENTICASFCKLLRPVNRLHSLILYWEIQDMQTSGRMLPLKKHGANGINNFDFDGFLNHELLIPDNACMLKPIEAIMAKISIIQGQFALLTEARDRLLPKLMNGEIEV